MTKSANDSAVGKLMPDAAFLQLGDGEVAYIRSLRARDMQGLFPQAAELFPEFSLWVLLGADGIPLMIAESREAVVFNAMEAQLTTVSVH